MSARCIGALAAVCQTEVMQEVVVKVIPKLSDVDEETSRQGAMECISCNVPAKFLFLLVYFMSRTLFVSVIKEQTLTLW